MSITKKRSNGARTPSKQRKYSPGSLVPLSTTRNPRVMTVIQFMETNLQRRISLNELSDAANLSRSYLCNLFKTHTGLPPGEYLRRLRMEKASHLLATTLLSIKQIIAMVGYSDRATFLRHFRRYFDSVPSEYRQRTYKIISANES